MLTAAEESFVIRKHKSSQDVFNFPPRLDHEFIGLASVVSSADAPPTKASIELYEQLEKKLAGVLAELKAVLEGDLAEFNRAVTGAGIPPVVVVPRVPPKEA